MVFDRGFPQVFARPVRGQIESQQGVVRFRQLFPQLNEKLFPFERNFDDFAPTEGVDFEYTYTFTDERVQIWAEDGEVEVLAPS